MERPKAVRELSEQVAVKAYPLILENVLSRRRGDSGFPSQDTLKRVAELSVQGSDLLYAEIEKTGSTSSS